MRLGLLLLLLLGSASLLGQRSAASDEVMIPGLRVGLTPTAVLNYYGGVQGTVRYARSDLMELGVETAYIYDGLRANTSGYRVRANARFFPFSNANKGMYFGAGYHYRSTSQKSSQWVDRFGGQYQEEIEVTRHRVFRGVPFLFGMVGEILPSVQIDLGIGGGPGTLDISIEGLPSDVDPIQFDNREFLFGTHDAGTHSVAMFYFHFAIMYHFD